MCVRTAGENAALNGVQNDLTVLVGDLSEKATGVYDVICANIVANAIIHLVPNVPALLAKHGTFLASGIIDTRKDEVIAAVQGRRPCTAGGKGKERLGGAGVRPHRAGITARQAQRRKYRAYAGC